jgi:hypothetical protein
VAWLAKRGNKYTSDLGLICSQGVEEVRRTLCVVQLSGQNNPDRFFSQIKRRQEGVTATPGRGVVGRPAIRLITGENFNPVPVFRIRIHIFPHSMAAWIRIQEALKELK